MKIHSVIYIFHYVKSFNGYCIIFDYIFIVSVLKYAQNKTNAKQTNSRNNVLGKKFVCK